MDTLSLDDDRGSLKVMKKQNTVTKNKIDKNEIEKRGGKIPPKMLVLLDYSKTPI